MVSPLALESMRARPINRRLRLTRRTLLAIATTYASAAVSRKSSTSGLAKPPSGRIRRMASVLSPLL